MVCGLRQSHLVTADCFSGPVSACLFAALLAASAGRGGFPKPFHSPKVPTTPQGHRGPNQQAIGAVGAGA